MSSVTAHPALCRIGPRHIRSATLRNYVEKDYGSDYRKGRLEAQPSPERCHQYYKIMIYDYIWLLSVIIRYSAKGIPCTDVYLLTASRFSVTGQQTIYSALHHDVVVRDVTLLILLIL